jgi:hypothetical protein
MYKAEMYLTTKQSETNHTKREGGAISQRETFHKFF